MQVLRSACRQGPDVDPRAGRRGAPRVGAGGGPPGRRRHVSRGTSTTSSTTPDRTPAPRLAIPESVLLEQADRALATVATLDEAASGWSSRVSAPGPRPCASSPPWPISMVEMGAAPCSPGPGAGGDPQLVESHRRLRPRARYRGPGGGGRRTGPLRDPPSCRKSTRDARPRSSGGPGGGGRPRHRRPPLLSGARPSGGPPLASPRMRRRARPRRGGDSEPSVHQTDLGGAGPAPGGPLEVTVRELPSPGAGRAFGWSVANAPTGRCGCAGSPWSSGSPAPPPRADAPARLPVVVTDRGGNPRRRHRPLRARRLRVRAGHLPRRQRRVRWGRAPERVGDRPPGRRRPAPAGSASPAGTSTTASSGSAGAPTERRSCGVRLSSGGRAGGRGSRARSTTSW